MAIERPSTGGDGPSGLGGANGVRHDFGVFRATSYAFRAARVVKSGRLSQPAPGTGARQHGGAHGTACFSVTLDANVDLAQQSLDLTPTGKRVGRPSTGSWGPSVPDGVRRVRHDSRVFFSENDAFCALGW